jgi:5-methylcytosine-specific restriction endonuclease McrA
MYGQINLDGHLMTTTKSTKELPKRIILFLLLILLLFPNDSFEQRKSRGYNSSYKSKSSYSYKTPKLKTYKNYNYKAPTYKVGGTKYKYDETYKTTGFPKVERSASAKKKFLKSKGYSKSPKGYDVDHIIPLSKGGKDVPTNMQLLPKETHKQKTANERRR